MEGGWFIRLFGGVLIAFSIFDLIARPPGRMPSFPSIGPSSIPFGLAGGFFGGAFNIGGPPVVAYAYSQGSEQVADHLDPPGRLSASVQDTGCF